MAIEFTERDVLRAHRFAFGLVRRVCSLRSLCAGRRVVLMPLPGSVRGGFTFPLDSRLSFLVCCLALTFLPAFAAVASLCCSALGNLGIASSSTPEIERRAGKLGDVPDVGAALHLTGNGRASFAGLRGGGIDERFQVLKLRT